MAGQPVWLIDFRQLSAVDLLILLWGLGVELFAKSIQIKYL